ncbi:MAG TPA: CBS domain-containing protein [Isosphaeraceae bacterium]|nr:CBS domain-containing protein [Isosphaeraceae bacterium]
MFRHLIAAIDGSDASLKALDRAIVLAARTGALLDIVSVEEEPPHYLSRDAEVRDARSDAERYYGALHAEAVLRAARRGVVTSTRILSGHEVRALLEDVRDHQADLLVIGATGHSGVWEMFLGSTAEKLVAHAPTSVLVVHPSDAGSGFKELVVGLDGSPLGERALAVALELGRLWGGTVRAISILEGMSSATTGQRLAEAEDIATLQARARAAAEAAGVRLDLEIRSGHAAEMLVGYAREVDADVIIIGATGRERPWSPTAGGTARRVANEAHCAVLLVRPPLRSYRVGDVMSRHVTTVTPDTPIQVVVDQLVRRGVKALPVVDREGRVVGIITGGDLMRRGGLGIRLSLRGSISDPDLAVWSRQVERSGLTAGQVMTPNPRTVTPDTLLDEAILLMVRHSVKRLPVTADGGRLAGIISRTDLLRALAADRPTAESRSAAMVLGRQAGDLADPDVAAVGPAASLEDVLAAVLASPFRRVVVVDAERHVLGIITDRDLLRRASPPDRPGLIDRLAGRRDPASRAVAGSVTAAALMNPDVFTIPADAPLSLAIERFLTLRVKRLVVVDADRRLIGILDRRAVLRSLVEQGDQGLGRAPSPSAGTETSA